MNYIKQSIHEGVIDIQLNRPEVLNAINMGMVEELKTTFSWAEANEAIRVIMVRGAGEKAFCSGGDLIEFHSIKTKEDALVMMNGVSQLLDLISSSSKLTIAAINGFAIGGGAELTSAFDIRICAEDAKIGFVQSKLGITTAWGGGSRLISLLGKAKALPLLIAGETLPAIDWKRIGYIDQIFSKRTFQEESLVYAQKFTNKNLDIIRSYKNLAFSGFDQKLLQQSIATEIEGAAKLWIGEEHLLAAEQFMQQKRNR